MQNGKLQTFLVLAMLATTPVFGVETDLSEATLTAGIQSAVDDLQKALTLPIRAAVGARRPSKSTTSKSGKEPHDRQAILSESCFQRFPDRA